jgi:hypothetical protein
MREASRQAVASDSGRRMEVVSPVTQAPTSAQETARPCANFWTGRVSRAATV